MTTIVQRSFFIVVVFCTLFSVQSSFVYAYTLGSPHWVTRPNVNGSLLFFGDCHYPENSEPYCDPPYCAPVIIDSFTNFGQTSGDGILYSDSHCSIPSGIPWTTWSKTKEVLCPTGEVMVGTRFYEWFKEIDSEHEDAKCATISGATLGSSRWVTPVNAYDRLNPGYKDAVCNTDEVMTGVRMYGVWKEVDDEHIIARCTRITGVVPGGSYYWKEAPNAYTTLYGAYKDASCNAGDIMRGVRWVETAIEVDQEHTNAYCYTPPPPKVNVWFSMLIQKVLNFI
jgi:hypothetical protein